MRGFLDFSMVSAGFRLLLGRSGVVSVVFFENGFRWFPGSARMQRRGFRGSFQWFPLVSGFCSDAVAWFPWVFPMVSAGFRLLLGCSGMVSVGFPNGFRWFPASALIR